MSPGVGSEYPYDAQHGKQEASVKMGNRCGLNYCNSSSYLEVGRLLVHSVTPLAFLCLDHLDLSSGWGITKLERLLGWNSYL